MQPRLDLPASREAPEHVLEGLRRVDPSVDVVWWGEHGFPAMRNGQQTTVVGPAWLICAPAPSAGWLREKAGERLMMFAKAPVNRQDPDRIRPWLLRYKGWRPVMFIPARDLDYGVVEDFRAADWTHKHMNTLIEEQLIARFGDDAQLRARTEQMREIVKATMGDIWRYAMRGRRGVLVQGLN